ncbi:MAG TPA: NADH-quinone oxidoreductase subunit NuoE [Micropepsaceae bacterium]|nr:NADH-quinone oxidoreductase subunit NuoE [Micropepsaceae bacterium]
MSVRRLLPDPHGTFAFTDANIAFANAVIAKYPEGRKASAVVPLLWRAQEQNGGWVSEPVVRYIANMLGLSYIRVYEIATFYTMFNLKPVGEHLLQVCTTTPCWLRGSDAVVAACKKHIAPTQQTVSSDGKLSWMEVECLGACVNAPVVQVGADFYEDLDGASTERLIADLRDGKKPKPGSQIDRLNSAPVGGATTLKEGV